MAVYDILYSKLYTFIRYRLYVYSNLYVSESQGVLNNNIINHNIDSCRGAGPRGFGFGDRIYPGRVTSSSLPLFRSRVQLVLWYSFVDSG